MMMPWNPYKLKSWRTEECNYARALQTKLPKVKNTERGSGPPKPGLTREASLTTHQCGQEQQSLRNPPFHT